MKKFLPLLAALLFASLATLHAAERKPNVVLILIDDFGYECATANGGESCKMPVMDKLAATGSTRGTTRAVARPRRRSSHTTTETDTVILEIRHPPQTSP